MHISYHGKQDFAKQGTELENAGSHASAHDSSHAHKAMRASRANRRTDLHSTRTSTMDLSKIISTPRKLRKF